jgi:nucleoid-associated protein YgaU
MVAISIVVLLGILLTPVLVTIFTPGFEDAKREAVEGRAGDAATIYVVRSGDNLSRIARAYYNDPGLWRLIYDANRRTIGDDPGRLRVGMRLTIPPAPKPADDSDDE